MYLIKQANMLKCTLEPGDRLSETQLMEITSGGHSSLLHCQKAQINGVMTLVYDTHAYNTMESSASHLTPQQMRQTILELLHALRQLERQSELSGLRMGNLCVEFDKVYLNGETLRPAFVYVPVESAKEFPEEELRSEIIETIQSNECVRDGGNQRIVQYLQDPANSLSGLTELIPRIGEEVSRPAPEPEHGGQLHRLQAENQRLRQRMLLFGGAAVLLIVIVVLLVLFGGEDKEQVDAVTETGTAASTENGTTEVALKPGDLNGDGKITKEDRELLAAAVNGEELLSPAQWDAADLNGDGKVDMNDCAELTLMETEEEQP